VDYLPPGAGSHCIFPDGTEFVAYNGGKYCKTSTKRLVTYDGKLVPFDARPPHLADASDCEGDDDFDSDGDDRGIEEYYFSLIDHEADAQVAAAQRKADQLAREREAVAAAAGAAAAAEQAAAARAATAAASAIAAQQQRWEAERAELHAALAEARAAAVGPLAMVLLPSPRNAAQPPPPAACAAVHVPPPPQAGLVDADLMAEALAAAANPSVPPSERQRAFMRQRLHLPLSVIDRVNTMAEASEMISAILEQRRRRG